MLRKDIVNAVEEKRFAVYAVKTIDEALSLLTGRPAGLRDRHGKFPPDSVNALVQDALKGFAKKSTGARRRKAEQSEK